MHPHLLACYFHGPSCYSLCSCRGPCLRVAVILIYWREFWNEHWHTYFDVATSIIIAFIATLAATIFALSGLVNTCKGNHIVASRYLILAIICNVIFSVSEYITLHQRAQRRSNSPRARPCCSLAMRPYALRCRCFGSLPHVAVDPYYFIVTYTLPNAISMIVMIGSCWYCLAYSLTQSRSLHCPSLCMGAERTIGS